MKLKLLVILAAILVGLAPAAKAQHRAYTEEKPTVLKSGPPDITQDFVSFATSYSAGTILHAPCGGAGALVNPPTVPDASCFREWGVPYRLYQSATQVVIGNSAVENDIATLTSAGITIPGGTLGTDNVCHLTLYATFIQNSVANDTVTLRVYYGATKMHDSISGNIPQSAAARPATFRIDLMGDGTTGTQRMHGSIQMGTTNAPTTGYGNLTGGTTIWTGQLIGGTSSLDSTVDRALRVTLQETASGAASTWTTRSVTVVCDP